MEDGAPSHSDSRRPRHTATLGGSSPLVEPELRTSGGRSLDVFIRPGSSAARRDSRRQCGFSSRQQESRTAGRLSHRSIIFNSSGAGSSEARRRRLAPPSPRITRSDLGGLLNDLPAAIAAGLQRCLPGAQAPGSRQCGGKPRPTVATLWQGSYPGHSLGGKPVPILPILDSWSEIINPGTYGTRSRTRSQLVSRVGMPAPRPWEAV